MLFSDSLHLVWSSLGVFNIFIGKNRCTGHKEKEKKKKSKQPNNLKSARTFNPSLWTNREEPIFLNHH